MHDVQDISGGLLYEILDQDNNSKGYLFGTVHRIEFEVNDPTAKIHDKVIEALRKCDSLVLEADMLQEKQLLVIKKFFQITNEELIEWIKKKNLKNGNRDLELLIAAYNQKKKLDYLEDINFNISLVKLVLDDAEKNIGHKVKQLKEDNTSLSEELLKFKETYEKVQRVGKALHKTEDEDLIYGASTFGLSPEVSKIMLEDRNFKWIETMDAKLRENSKHFFGVGVAHLVKQIGLVNLLAQRGWKLNQIILRY